MNLGVQRLNAGIVDYEKGKFDDAIFKLEMAKIQISEDDKESLWSVHFYSGLSYCLTGDHEEAMKEFVRASEIFKGRIPDPETYSPKIVTMFKETIMRAGSGVSGTYTGSIAGMEFLLIKGGCFDMGDNFGDGSGDENPEHEVCLDDFYIGKYEITQGQWEEVMGDNPSKSQKGRSHPVENVSWNDIQKFIKKLNEKTGRNYRLPTEAEWEYAARSGGKSEKFAGTSDKSELGRYAWYSDNSDSRTHPVGQKESNGLGLYDMSGNVYEWVWDNYDEEYYERSRKDNPKGLLSGKYKVLRGGSWYVKLKNVRSADRFRLIPYYKSSNFGFRLARAVN